MQPGWGKAWASYGATVATTGANDAARPHGIFETEPGTPPALARFTSASDGMA
jgi:hypothetical protein